MLKNIIRRNDDGGFKRLELWTLGALLFVLPTFEAPKNVLAVLFLIIWCARRLSGFRLATFRPDAPTSVVLVIVAVAAASTWSNWPFPNGGKGLVDTFRIAACFLAVYAGGYTATQHMFLARTIVAGLLFSIGYAVWELATKRTPALELHSVGILTQSAMYVSVVLILVLGVLVTRRFASPSSTSATATFAPASPTFWRISAVIIASALLLMASRGAILGVAVAALLSAVILRQRIVWVALALIAVVGVVAAAALTSLDRSDPVIDSFKTRVSLSRMAYSNRERLEYMRIGLVHFREGDDKLLGIGPRNFGSIDVSRLHFDPPLLLNDRERTHLSHAHNIFLTKLVEEGVLGLAALLTFFTIVVRALHMQWRLGRHNDWRWFAALASVTIPNVTGQFNTPFYQEHAMLDMIIIAVFLSSMGKHGTRRS